VKVLHLVAGELTGGAARGAYWLHRGLREIGVDSHVLTNGRETYGDPSVTSLCKSGADKVRFALSNRLENLPIHLYRKRQGLIYNTGVNGIDITRHPLYESADIIHLHWINGLVNMHSLRKVKKPLIWTMRDMWPMTGGCHVALECDGYRGGCGKCPQLGSKMAYDLSRAVFMYKKQMLPTNAIMVGISNWISGCARESKLFCKHRVITISNNIDTQEFSPIGKGVAKTLLSLPEGKKIILLGSTNIADPWKGFDLFKTALEYLDKSKIHLMVFGKASSQSLSGLGVSYSLLGVVTDTLSLRAAYSAADLYVAPYRMDSFGKTLAESMSCGTPVVCFDASGPKDIVEHKVSGYRAKPFDSRDLADGMQWMLSASEDVYSVLCENARLRAVAQFDSLVIARKYKALYEEVEK